ncbi:unnamed protein product [Nippostrongylus brasiliensis]|uniref:C-type lectin domain-containing protein n=1 Tax=Nippostrongylus brasiliensis TaxID=27835 RepID=A0A0N4YFC5_NIPBR|nr:unnamed protein product [Nippostrongylus brasiliensis]
MSCLQEKNGFLFHIRQIKQAAHDHRWMQNGTSGSRPGNYCYCGYSPRKYGNYDSAEFSGGDNSSDRGLHDRSDDGDNSYHGVRDGSDGDNSSDNGLHDCSDKDNSSDHELSNVRYCDQHNDESSNEHDAISICGYVKVTEQLSLSLGHQGSDASERIIKYMSDSLNLTIEANTPNPIIVNWTCRTSAETTFLSAASSNCFRAGRCYHFIAAGDL